MSILDYAKEAALTVGTGGLNQVYDYAEKKFKPSTAPDPAQAAAEAQQEQAFQHASDQYQSYRPQMRQNYANQISDQSSLYQGVMDRLASAYGQQSAPNVSQIGHALSGAGAPAHLLGAPLPASASQQAGPAIALQQGGLHAPSAMPQIGQQAMPVNRYPASHQPGQNFSFAPRQVV